MPRGGGAVGRHLWGGKKRRKVSPLEGRKEKRGKKEGTDLERTRGRTVFLDADEGNQGND